MEKNIIEENKIDNNIKKDFLDNKDDKEKNRIKEKIFFQRNNLSITNHSIEHNTDIEHIGNDYKHKILYHKETIQDELPNPIYLDCFKEPIKKILGWRNGYCKVISTFDCLFRLKNEYLQIKNIEYFKRIPNIRYIQLMTSNLIILILKMINIYDMNEIIKYLEYFHKLIINVDFKFSNYFTLTKEKDNITKKEYKEIIDINNLYNQVLIKLDNIIIYKNVKFDLIRIFDYFIENSKYLNIFSEVLKNTKKIEFNNDDMIKYFNAFYYNIYNVNRSIGDYLINIRRNLNKEIDLTQTFLQLVIDSSCSYKENYIEGDYKIFCKNNIDFYEIFNSHLHPIQDNGPLIFFAGYNYKYHVIKWLSNIFKIHYIQYELNYNEINTNDKIISKLNDNIKDKLNIVGLFLNSKNYQEIYDFFKLNLEIMINFKSNNFDILPIFTLTTIYTTWWHAIWGCYDKLNNKYYIFDNESKFIYNEDLKKSFNSIQNHNDGDFEIPIIKEYNNIDDLIMKHLTYHRAIKSFEFNFIMVDKNNSYIPSYNILYNQIKFNK